MNIRTLLTLTVSFLFFHTSFSQTPFNITENFASDRDRDDLFGWSTDLNGKYAIVGATREEHNSTGGDQKRRSGSAYIYTWDTIGKWNHVQKITASDRQEYDEFGQAVAIMETHAVVGSFKHDYDSAGSDFKEDAGACYVYQQDSSGVWSQQQKLLASDRGKDQEFGSAVAIRDSMILVGAPYEINGGAVYAFRLGNNGTWRQVQKIVSNDLRSGDHFGSSIDLLDSVALIGTYGDNSAYIFHLNARDTWEQKQRITSPDRTVGDAFGFRVGLGSSVLVVGAYLENHDDSGTNYQDEAGSAYIFELDTTNTWQYTQKIVASDREKGDRFGIDVATNGTQILVGAHHNDHFSTQTSIQYDAGMAYVFEKSDTTWKETHQIAPDNLIGRDRFGFSVAMDHERWAVTASTSTRSSRRSYAGSVYFIEPCVNDSSASDASACERYTWPVNQKTYTKTGVYSDTLLNQWGCDSILTLDLTIFEPTHSYDTITACDSFLWPSTNEWYFNSGNLIDISTNSAGCDSLIHLNLTINRSSIQLLDTIACNSYTWSANDSTYFVSGTYEVKFTAENGCDSLMVLTLEIGSPYENRDTLSACYSYTWSVNQQEYTSSGIYSESYTSRHGCDSTMYLHLTIDTVNTRVSVLNDSLFAEENNATYQWLDCDMGYDPIPGETNRKFVPSTRGNYSVEVTANSCTDTSACYNLQPSSLGHITQKIDIQLYPNPNSGEVTLHIPTGFSSIHMEIFDAVGQRVNTDPNQVDVNTQMVNLPKGIHFIYIYSDGNRIALFKSISM